MSTTRTLPFLLALGLFLAGCSDALQDTPTEPPEIGGPFMAVLGHCDLSDARKAARDYFPSGSDERKTANATIRTMQNQCEAGLTTALDASAWSIVRLVEDVLEQRTSEENDAHTSPGGVLVNVMLACTLEGGSCASGHDVGEDFTSALGTSGLFDVVSDGSAEVLARGVVEFADWNGRSDNGALWALASPAGAGWSRLVLGHDGDDILFYGGPATGLITINEPSIGAGQYDLDVYPAKTTQSQISVATCLLEAVHSHPPGGEPGDFAPRVQRETTLLESSAVTPSECASFLSFRGYTVQQASLFAMFGALLPRPLRAFLTDEEGVPLTSGDLSNFSTFGAVVASTTGELVFTEAPSDDDGVVEVVGQDFDITVLARTAGGLTPLEKVSVTVSVKKNNGQGAEFDSGPTITGLTGETDGTVTFTTSLLQPGGYVICAEGVLEGFEFPGEFCGDLFHVKNHTE